MTIDYNDHRAALRTTVNSSGLESDSRMFVFGNYVDEVLVMRFAAGMEFYYAHDHLHSPAALFNAVGTAGGKTGRPKAAVQTGRNSED